MENIHNHALEVLKYFVLTLVILQSTLIHSKRYLCQYTCMFRSYTCIMKYIMSFDKNVRYTPNDHSKKSASGMSNIDMCNSWDVRKECCDSYGER
jgi:hypothetical protein